MADLIVKYNGVTLSPTPLVQQSYQFIDYGSRWGNVTEIELNGNITGITGQVTSVQTGFAANFTGQFGTLQVLDGASTLYQWNNVIIDEISFPPNHLFINSIAPYSVKMKSINVPSGIVDPVNEYSFVQNEDGTVTVNHKIAARGIKTSSNGGLYNAIGFVQNFTGKNPFSNAVGSNNGPAFVPLGSGILLSLSESIDRTTSAYSVQEVYKYNTGLFNPYVELWNVSVSDVMDNEWLTVDVDWRLQGSAVNLSVAQVEAALTSPLSKIASLGYATGNFVQSNSVYTRDTGAALISIKASYLSGYDSTSLTGYFDYTISLSFDALIPLETWRIEGDFFCLGPRDYRNAQIAQFKAANGSNWRNYLTGLIINSPVYTFHDSSKSFGGYSDIDIHENTGLGQFHLSLSTSDGTHSTWIWNPKYTLTVQPNKWNYDMLPSANIEGHYVLQDLQMMNQARVNIGIVGETKDVINGLNQASGFLATLSSVYLTTGYSTSLSYNTGIYDISIEGSWIGMDSESSGLLYTRVAGSTLTNFLRPPGYKFGY